jgi:hypothetical protein
MVLSHLFLATKPRFQVIYSLLLNQDSLKKLLNYLIVNLQIINSLITEKTRFICNELATKAEV